MTPTIEQIDSALKELPTGDDFNNHVGHESSDFLYTYGDTILFALRALRLLVDEPTDQIVKVCEAVKVFEEGYTRGCLKLMRDKLLEKAGEK